MSYETGITEVEGFCPKKGKTTVAQIMRDISREIGLRLVSDHKHSSGVGQIGEPREGKVAGLWQMLLAEIAKEVVKQLKEGEDDLSNDIKIHVNGKDQKACLVKAEQKLGKRFDRRKHDTEEKDIENINLDDLDDTDLETIAKLEKKGVQVVYPNLKYRKPKYQNVTKLLKYVESDKDKGETVKLVIMNFND